MNGRYRGERLWWSQSGLCGCRIGRVGVLLALSLGLCGVASGQWVGVDPAFPADGAPSDTVRALAMQADGRLLIGGSFTNLEGVAQRHLARLEVDGVLDLSFAPEIGSAATGIEALPDGRMLISGNFTNVNGNFRPGLARLQVDGSLDDGFEPPPGPGASYSLVGTTAPDGSVYVTGVFTNLGGLPAHRLARLLSDGSVDSTFRSPFAPTNTVAVVALQPDGRPLISGSFTNVGNLPANNLVRLNLDGSVDHSFRSGLGANERIRRSVLGTDGRLVAAVSIVNVYEIVVAPLRLVRFEPDGSLDPAFLVSLESPGFAFSSEVYALELQSDGGILVAGTFLRVNGVPRARVARLEPDGTVDYCFDVALGAELVPLALTSGPDGSIVVGGLFNGLQGEWRPNLVRLLPPAECDPGLIEIAVPALLVREDAGRVIVPVVRRGGADLEQTVTFETRDGSARGGLDFEAVSGTLQFRRGERSRFVDVGLRNGGEPGSPKTFEVVLKEVGGGASLGALTNAVITMLDPLPGTAGAPDTEYVVQLDGPVRVILPLADGRAVIAGAFTNVNGLRSPNLARLRADGSLDAGFNRAQPLDGEVQSLALDSLGRLLIAGRFRHVDGVPRPGLARLGGDGTLDQGFAPFADWPTHSEAYTVEIEAVCVLADGSVVCGGSAPTGDAALRRSLFRCSQSGELDAAFLDRMPPRVVVSGLTALADGDFLICGAGLGASLVRVRADGTINLGYLPAADRQAIPYYAASLGLMPDGRVVVAGTTSSFQGMPGEPPVWRLNPDASQDAGFMLPPTLGPLGTIYRTDVLSVAEDGRVVIAGDFSNANESRPTLARLHADGSFDWSFDAGAGLQPISSDAYTSLSALAALPAGGWLIGGDFGGYDGFNQRYLVRLLPESQSRPGTIQFAITNVTVWETNGVVTLEVFRRGDARERVSVRMRTENGTAAGDEDFEPQDVWLEFATGEWSRTVSVTLLDDRLVESVEWFMVRLLEPTEGFDLGTASAVTVYVESDDAGVEFIADEFHALEEDGIAQGAVTWSGAPSLSAGAEVRVNIVPVTGQSEDLGVAWVPVNRVQHTLLAGTNWFRIPIVDDANPEGPELFRLELAGNGNVIPGPRSTATLVVADEDFATTPGRGVAGVVEAIASAPQGGVYLVGDFTGVHGVPRSRVARLRSDGLVDLDFDPRKGPNGNVTAVGVQRDGKVVIAGEFDMVDGVMRAGFARLDEEGALDLSFDPGRGAEHTQGVPFIRVVLPQADGSVWIAGAFTHFDGRSSRLLARLRADGRVDSGFASPFTDGSVLWGAPRRWFVDTTAVQALVTQAEGKILVGGLGYLGVSPTTAVPVSVVRLQWDGQIDTGFQTMSSLRPTQAWSLASNPEGKLVVGGDNTLGGWLDPQRPARTNWIVINRFDSSGRPDPGFEVREAPQISFVASRVRQLLVEPDGRILFSAEVQTSLREPPHGTVVEHAIIGRLLPDGAWDSSFAWSRCALPELWQSDPFWSNRPTGNPGETAQAPVSTAWLARQPDGVLVLAGSFYAVNEEPRRRLARLNADGVLRGKLGLELNGGELLRLGMPGEVEVPYVIEMSHDLEHWSNWLLNGYPWWAVELWLPTSGPALFFRARPVP